MRTPLRRAAAALVLLAGLVLTACGSQATPSSNPSTPALQPTSPAPSASVETEADVEARLSYSAAICPIFNGILELDPRLQAIRDAGAAGGDMTPQAGEIGQVGAVLLTLLEDLEAVPEWQAGASLRFHLTTALHGIRAQLLHVVDDPAAGSAAEELANLPFIATDAMDIAVQDAVDGGLSCEDTP